MAPATITSATAIKDAVLDLYKRSTSSLWERSIEESMNNSIGKRSNFAKAENFSTGIIVIFALLGGGMALSVWWFFQKNGGFVWKEDDWDDYKSSVMRRKGPDGKTISSGSTRAPETVVTDITYQSETTVDDARTEKQSQAGRETPKWAKRQKPQRNNSKRSIRSGLGVFSRWRKRDHSPTSTERDPDLESYADEEPARMRSYNPHPVHAPSIYSESDISQAHEEERRDKSAYNGKGRHPSRYAYTYSSTSPEKSSPLAQRQSTKKSSKRSSSSSSRTEPKRQPTKRMAAQPDLSTIADETETRLSFEAEDDAAFTVYSESISRPEPVVASTSKRQTSTKGTKAYPYPMSDPTKAAKKRSEFSSSSRTGRKHSAGTYQTASTDSSDSECPSDCSCCTTESDSSDDEGTNVSERFRESARGDLGTKAYHHPLGLGINPNRISSPVPGKQIMVGKRGNPAQNNDRRVVAARSYRQESRGSLSSDSEGDSGNETVTSRVRAALNGKR